MTAALDANVYCLNAAEMCCCHQPAGHDGHHRCQDASCGGQWSGDIDGDDFDVAVLPTLIFGIASTCEHLRPEEDK